MMAPHPGSSDNTAGTYNTNVTCKECDVTSYFFFHSPFIEWLGWFGGCG